MPNEPVFCRVANESYTWHINYVTLPKLGLSIVWFRLVSTPIRNKTKLVNFCEFQQKPTHSTSSIESNLTLIIR